MKQLLKQLSSVKGTASSHFSPSQNSIAVKNVFDANTEFLVSCPSFPSLLLQLILLKQCTFTYFYCCVLRLEPPEYAQNFSMIDQNVQTYLAVSIRTKRCKCTFSLMELMIPKLVYSGIDFIMWFE